MKDYKVVAQEEESKEITVVASPVPDTDKSTVINGQQEEAPATEGASSTATRQQVRGAGVAGGFVGLVFGGPILAVIGGIAAAKIAQTNSTPGKFCRTQGKRVAKGIVTACDWVKAKMQPDGEQDDNDDEQQTAATEVVPAVVEGPEVV